MEAKKQSWKEATIAGVITKPRSSIEYKTGAWRSQTPVIDYAKCTRCLICWIYCPEPAIVRVLGNPDRAIEINQDYCKGCGICAQVCPVKCIEMRQG
ncbi:MAG: 4Fe-4S dicluster-binding protein [Thermoproteota archaeon]